MIKYICLSILKSKIGKELLLEKTQRRISVFFLWLRHEVMQREHRRWSQTGLGSSPGPLFTSRVAFDKPSHLSDSKSVKRKS